MLEDKQISKYISHNRIFESLNILDHQSFSFPVAVDNSRELVDALKGVIKRAHTDGYNNGHKDGYDEFWSLHT